MRDARDVAGRGLLTDWSFGRIHLSPGVERSWWEAVETGLDPSPGRPPSRRRDLGQVASCLRACLLICKMPCQRDRLGTGPESQCLKARGPLLIHGTRPSRVGPRSRAHRSSTPGGSRPIVFHWAEPVTCPRGTSRGPGRGGPEAGLVTLTSWCAVRVMAEMPWVRPARAWGADAQDRVGLTDPGVCPQPSALPLFCFLTPHMGARSGSAFPVALPIRGPP